jgi:hypothetical protein
MPQFVTRYVDSSAIEVEIPEYMDSEDRYFLATVLWGRLHPNGIPQWGPWDSSRLHWWTEDYLTLLRDRKVRTAEKLEAVMKEPMGVAPTWTVWIHKSLEDEARRLWEMGRG